MANLKDIAKLAGVSAATVSRVINKANNVDPVTEENVMKIIKRMNYKPSTVAQRLRSQNNRSKLIGLILPDIQNPFYIDVIHGVESYASKAGYAVVIGNYSKDEKKELLYMDIFQAESVVGFVVAPIDRKDKKVRKLIELGSSVVCVNSEMDDFSTDSVMIDNEKGVFDAVEHLVGIGHRRIALITGSKNMPVTAQKINGYKRALTYNDIPIVDDYVKLTDATDQKVSELVHSLLNHDESPTAIIAGSNLITLEILETLHRSGLNIPQDVAVIGFDDIPWFSAANPPMTAVRQSGFEMGTRAAQLLIQRINEPDRSCARLIMKTELVIRKSCGANYTPT